MCDPRTNLCMFEAQKFKLNAFFFSALCQQLKSELIGISGRYQQVFWICSHSTQEKMWSCSVFLSVHRPQHWLFFSIWWKTHLLLSAEQDRNKLVFSHFVSLHIDASQIPVGSVQYPELNILSVQCVVSKCSLDWPVAYMSLCLASHLNLPTFSDWVLIPLDR